MITISVMGGVEGVLVVGRFGSIFGPAITDSSYIIWPLTIGIMIEVSVVGGVVVSSVQLYYMGA